jgi:acyl dehydratase
LSAAAHRRLIGRTWPPIEYEVGREKIREYAAVVGEQSPIYYQADEARAVGFRSVVAPPMFCAVYCAPAVAQAVFDPEVGIDRARFVHGEQSFEWFAPVCAGDAVTTTCQIVEAYPKGDNAFYVFASESRNQRDEETMRARYTGIVRGGASDVIAGPGDGADSGDRDRPSDRTLEPPPGLAEGAALPEFSVTPDRYVPHRYAGVSGDFTPIHLDAEFAQAVGMPGIILHGLYTMAIVARAQVEGVGGDPRLLRTLRVQFRGVALPEVEIKVTSSVAAITDGVAIVKTRAVQSEVEVIREGEAHIAREVS